MKTNWMEFCPSIKFPFGKIIFVKKWKEYKILKNPFLTWIALFCHELCHFWDWIFVYNLNSEKWNANEFRQEKKANKIQDFITKEIYGFSFY